MPFCEALLFLFFECVFRLKLFVFIYFLSTRFYHSRFITGSRSSTRGIAIRLSVRGFLFRRFKVFYGYSFELSFILFEVRTIISGCLFLVITFDLILFRLFSIVSFPVISFEFLTFWSNRIRFWRINLLWLGFIFTLLCSGLFFFLFLF